MEIKISGESAGWLLYSHQCLALIPVQAEHFTLENIFQMLFHGNGLNIGRSRQNILFLIEICLAAHFNSPLSGLRIKNICPFIFAWVYKQTLCARR